MDGDEIKRKFESLSKKELMRINEKEMADAKRDFENFKIALEKGQCCFCTDSMESFHEDKPCFHWLLRPEGCKKVHIGQLLEQSRIGFFRITSFLRWLANTEIIGANINNLTDEISSSKKIELTIKYKNFEWSFSCSPSDFEGHNGRIQGTLPHYHFAMKIEGQGFIRFGDFHALFTNEDLFNFKAIEVGVMKWQEIYGASSQDLMDIFEPEKLLDTMVSVAEPEKSAFHLQTMITAEPGKTISGELLIEMLQEGKDRGLPIARIAKERELKAQTIISPGEGIPKMFKRKSRKDSI